MVWSSWRDAVADPDELDRALLRTPEQWDAVMAERAEAEEAEQARRMAELSEIAEWG